MTTADHSMATLAAPLVAGEVKVRGVSCQERILWFLTELWQVNIALGLGPCEKAKVPHSHFYPSKWTVALLACSSSDSRSKRKYVGLVESWLPA